MLTLLWWVRWWRNTVREGARLRISFVLGGRVLFFFQGPDQCVDHRVAWTGGLRSLLYVYQFPIWLGLSFCQSLLMIWITLLPCHSIYMHMKALLKIGDIVPASQIFLAPSWRTCLNLKESLQFKIVISYLPALSIRSHDNYNNFK